MFKNVKNNNKTKKPSCVTYGVITLNLFTFGCFFLFLISDMKERKLTTFFFFLKETGKKKKHKQKKKNTSRTILERNVIFHTPIRPAATTATATSEFVQLIRSYAIVTAAWDTSAVNAAWGTLSFSAWAFLSSQLPARSHHCPGAGVHITLYFFRS